jgi:hypothetical protein
MHRSRPYGRIARRPTPITLTDQPVRLYHYRDRDRYKVDAVLESASGEVVACEVKAAETVRSKDFRGILWGSAAGPRLSPRSVRLNL